MYTIWMLTLALGVVSADIGLGYHYKVPETSYGVPSHQILSSGRNTGFTGSSASNLGSLSGTSFTSAQAPIYSTASSNTGFGNANAYKSGLGSGFNYAQANTGESGFSYNSQGFGAGYNYNGLGSSNQGVFQGSTGHSGQSNLNGYYQTAGSQPSQSIGSGHYKQYQTAAVNKYQEYYNQIVQQPPQVFKHFYVHAAPEEPPVAKPRQPLVLPPTQKHYKIIFIKTPEQHAPAPQLIPVPQQNEEKTIVYVLVKNPEEAQNIVLPKIEPKPPTKPEVFFIKYDDKHDSQSVINNIVNDYDRDGVSSSFANIETNYAAVKESGPTASSVIIGGGGGTSEFGSSGSGNSGGFGSLIGGSTGGFSSMTSSSSSGFSSSTGGNTGGFGSSTDGSSGGFGSSTGGSTGGFGSSTDGSSGGFSSSTGGSTGGFSSSTGGSSGGFGSSTGGSSGGFGSSTGGSSGGFGSSSSGSSGGFSSSTGGSSGGFGSSTGGITSGVGSATSGANIADGSFAVSSTSSENSFGGTVSEVDYQGSGSFGSTFTSGGPTIATSSGGESNSFSSGLERIFGAPGSSISTSTASSLSGFDANAISTSQGVPHETYGVPKFKEY